MVWCACMDGGCNKSKLHSLTTVDECLCVSFVPHRILSCNTSFTNFTL